MWYVWHIPIFLFTLLRNLHVQRWCTPVVKTCTFEFMLLQTTLHSLPRKGVGTLRENRNVPIYGIYSITSFLGRATALLYNKKFVKHLLHLRVLVALLQHGIRSLYYV